MGEDVIYASCTLALFAMVFTFFALWRYLRYKETVALAERGLVRPQSGNGRDALRWGIVITAIGLALMIGLYPAGVTLGLGDFPRGGAFPMGFGPWMLIGLLPTFFGLALILVHVVTRENGADEEEPGSDDPIGEPPDTTEPPGGA
jgi:hypothetical protein